MKKIYNKTKTKRITGFLLLPFVLLLSACSLEEDLYDRYDKNNYFTSTDKLKMAVNGVYSSFSSLQTYGQYWMVYDTDTDLSHVQGASLGHTARDLGHYNIQSSHTWLQESWASYYTGIENANIILERQSTVPLKASEADTLLFNNLIAQTKVLRAMCYFDLVRLFGDVPLMLEPEDLKNPVFKPKTDRSVIYDVIINDIREAIPNLTWHDAMPQSGERISKGAAMGMLARIYLFRGGYALYGEGSTGTMKRPDNYKEYYTEAKKVLDELIGSQKHGLLSSYEQVFRNMCELKYDPFENMLEISFWTQAGKSIGASVQGSYNGPSINAQSSYGRANSFIKTQNFFYDWFDADGSDLRRDVSVATFSINASNAITQINRKQSYNWAPGKWRRNWHTGVFKDNNNTDVNVVLLRYADVLLMRAEVENELNGGPNADAVEALNQVRRRAYGKPYLTPNAALDFKVSDFAGKDAFFNYLFKERARELAFEGHRRMDLIRWNLLDQTIKNTDEAFKTAVANKEMNAYTFKAGELFKHNVHELYPIPDYDIREAGGMLIQNPGYN